ncbi:MAG TPA: BlaI/MecI/CopY family transcriptional regulator [Pirellulales bacterium]|jgi:predicted transcriptional regulator
MTRRKESLGKLEIEVLRYVGDHFPITVREIAAHFAELSGHARTTLLTVVERLRSKGFLTRRKIGGLQHYSPTADKAEFLHGMVADFVDDVLGGNVSPFVAYLGQSSQLTDDEARRIAQLLKRLEAREQKGES